jgi:hypothetical protein
MVSGAGFCETLKPETLSPETETLPIVSKENSLQPIETEKMRFGPLVEKLDKDSQAQWLNAGDEIFLALYRPANGANGQGAVLIVADDGQHPDWPGPVRYLRNSLPQHGWATLSLALPYQPSKENKTLQEQSPLPPLETSAKLTLRLQGAMTHIQSLGLYNIVVIALGDGAPLAALSLRDLPADSYAGFIALAPWSLDEQTQTAMTEAYTDLPAGVLEIVPALWPDVGLTKRKGLAEKKQHANYSQVRLLGDIKHFRDSPQLLPRIRGWLKRNAEAMEGQLQRPEDKN